MAIVLYGLSLFVLVWFIARMVLFNQGQSSERGAAIQVLTVAERARTVNAKGEYIDKRWVLYGFYLWHRNLYTCILLEGLSY